MKSRLCKLFQLAQHLRGFNQKPRNGLTGDDPELEALFQAPPTFHLRTSPVGLAIDVSRGFPLRDTLRLRGYRFSRPHWRIWFKRESDRAAEVRWLLSQGAQESRAEEAGAA